MEIKIIPETIGSEIIRCININTEIEVKTDQIRRKLRHIQYWLKNSDHPESSRIIQSEIPYSIKAVNEWNSFYNWMNENGHGQNPKLSSGIRYHNQLQRIVKSLQSCK